MSTTLRSIHIPQHCCPLLFTQTGDFRPVGLTQVDHDIQLVDHQLIMILNQLITLRRSFSSVKCLLHVDHYDNNCPLFFSLQKLTCILVLIEKPQLQRFTGVVAKGATYNFADAPFYLSIYLTLLFFSSFLCSVLFLFSLCPVEAKFFFVSCFVEVPFS